MVSLNLMSQLGESDFAHERALMQSEFEAVIDGEQVQQPGEGLDILATDGLLGASDFPRDHCCFIYDDRDFGGSRAEFCHHGHDQVFGLWNYNFNDKMESFKCGATTKITICNGDLGLGNCNDYSQNYLGSSSGHVQVKRIGRQLRNEVTSIQLKPYNYRQHGAVTVFDEEDCWGHSASFEHTGRNGQVQTSYQASDLVSAGIGENYIGSVMVPEGYVAELYDWNSQSGTKESRFGGYADSNKRMVCQNLRHTDTTSSLIIRPYRQGSAVGRWEPIAISTETINYEKIVGLTAADKDTASRTEQNIISASMTLGLEFEGVGSASYGIESSYETQIRNDVEHSYSQTQTEKITTTCTVGAGESGAGLWQWVVSTGDSSVTHRHLMSICKTGEGFNVTPKCPIHACVDGTCERCMANWSL